MIDLADRIMGAIYGVAIGDAMGGSTVFMSPDEIRAMFGQVGGLSISSPYSDDTELTLQLAEVILEEGHADPVAVARKLIAWADSLGDRVDIVLGPSTRAALARLRSGVSAYESGAGGSTNGCAMKIMPIAALSAAAHMGLDGALEEIRSACAPTHSAGVALSGAAAVCASFMACMSGSSVEAAVAEGSAAAQRACAALGGCGALLPRIREATSMASIPHDGEFCDRLYEFYIDKRGALTEDAVPAALAIALRAGGDVPRAAVLAAVAGGDSDTVGAMAAGISGACTGYRSLPEELVRAIDEFDGGRLRRVATEFARRMVSAR